jgi:hypothetical protein
MRTAWMVLVVALCASAQDDKKEVVSVVNKLFEGMAAGDSGAISPTMTLFSSGRGRLRRLQN